MGSLAAFGARKSVLSVAAALIAGLAINAVVLARDAGRHSRAQPSAIQVLDGNIVSFRLKGVGGADLAVQSLRSGQGPSTVWITLVASGLPRRGIDYQAIGGDCLGIHPRTLAVSSGMPDPRTGILTLNLNNMPASDTELIWVKVADVSGVELGAVRGQFFAPNSRVAIAPGQSVCP